MVEPSVTACLHETEKGLGINIKASEVSDDDDDDDEGAS